MTDRIILFCARGNAHKTARMCDRNAEKHADSDGKRLFLRMKGISGRQKAVGE